MVHLYCISRALCGGVCLASCGEVLVTEVPLTLTQLDPLHERNADRASVYEREVSQNEKFSLSLWLSGFVCKTRELPFL